MTGAPFDVQISATRCSTVELSWTAPADGIRIPPVFGYEVFYSESDSDVTYSGGVTTDTAINVTLPFLGVSYKLFVVAFSNEPQTLPSAHSNVAFVTLSEFDIVKY